MTLLAVILALLLIGWLVGGMVLMMFDIDRACDEAELDELWDDECRVRKPEAVSAISSAETSVG